MYYFFLLLLFSKNSSEDINVAIIYLAKRLYDYLTTVTPFFKRHVNNQVLKVFHNRHQHLIFSFKNLALSFVSGEAS